MWSVLINIKNSLQTVQAKAALILSLEIVFLSLQITAHLLLVLMATLPCYCNAEFTEYPSNITLPVGSAMNAVFRCRHPTADYITWMINELPRRDFPEDIIPGSTRPNGTLVYTLTIPARLKHNGAVVVCVAVLFDGLQTQTPPAILIILAGEHVLMTTAGIVSTEVTTDQQTMQKPTTEPTPMLSIMNFIQIPSPSMVVIAPKSEYTFYCNHSQTTTISWKLNGITFDFVDLPPDVDFGSESSFGVRVYTLTLRGLPEYNGTRIQCVAKLNGVSVETSTAIFLIQGPLQQSVVDLARNVNTLSWEAPFSLDLTGVDPDIIYCVEVYNITCGRSLLISECDVMETNYTNNALLPGYIYEYTITPRNNVEGASNGTSINVTEEYVVLEESLMGHSVVIMKSNITMNDLETRAIVHLEVYDHDVAEEIRPALYSIFFNSLDGVETHPNFSEASTLVNRKDFVVLEIAPLSFRRLWNIRVYAHDCEYHPLTDKLELGTHDFHNITVISPSDNPGTIMVTGDIMPGSTSIGILVIVYSESLGNDSNIHYKMIEHTKVQQQRMYPVTTGLPVDEYQVAVFVVEEDGKPFPRAAATPRTVRINGIQQSSPANIEYEIQPNSAGVCVNCTFLDSAATSCVAVVHQRISQLGSSGLMNITESHKFIKSGNDAYIYECIGGVDMRKQQVGVIGGVRKTAINSEESQLDQCSTLCVAVVTAVIAIALILALSIIILFIFVYISRKRQKNRLIQQIPVSMQVTAVSVDILEPDTRYETVQLSVRTQYGHSQDEMDANSATSPPTVSDNDPTPKPVTLEHVLPELLPLASKWQSLGEALSLDEDQLDEIFTNNETDEACLEVMLEQYMAKPYLNHSWEEIQKALKQIGEELTIDQPEVPSRGKTETIHSKLPSGEDLTEQEDTLNQEIISQKSVIEEVGPTEDPPLHTEPKYYNEDTYDASQQGSNLSDSQPEHIDKDDYPSSFDEQANEPNESINQNDGQFESGKGTSPASETASITSDNRSVYDTNKSEHHQSNICVLLAFHTECEEQNSKDCCDVIAPRSGTCSWSEGVDGASELVISSNWNFLHYCLHSKGA